MTAIRAARRLPPSSIALPVLGGLGVWASLTGASGETVLWLVICAALVALVALGASHVVAWRGGTSHADTFVELLMRLVVGASFLGTVGVAVLSVATFASASFYSVVGPALVPVLLGAGYVSVRSRSFGLVALALLTVGYVATVIIALAETAGCWDCRRGDVNQGAYFIIAVGFFSGGALAGYALVVTGAVIARLTGNIDP
jgi:hypothetical protein